MRRGEKAPKSGREIIPQRQLEALAQAIAKKYQARIGDVRREIREHASELLEEREIPEGRLHELDVIIQRRRFD